MDCRKNRMGLLVLLVLASMLLVRQAEAVTRPNILFIYTDDHSHRTVSCYDQAYPWVETPHIDQLASTGVRFSDAYVGTWCMPSRAAMLTGHHPYGVQTMRMVGQYPGSEYDPAACPFWPSVFREHGYVTAQIGKWHTGVDTGAGRDWDYQVVWNRPRYPDNAGHYYYDELIETNGGEPEMVKGYSTDNYTEWAVDFIRGEHRDPEKPWYLWLCFGAVHGPFTPAERHLEAYDDIEVPTPADIYPPRPGKPAYMQKVAYWKQDQQGRPALTGGFQALTVNTQGIHGNTLTDWVRQYHQGVLALDESVGKLMAVLKQTGQLENTLVVFTSDQGFAWGQHGFRMKLAPYDANLRSPLIVSMPGTIPAGKTVATPVGGVDLVPTFFHFAGLRLPWKMHGHDLSPLLEHAEKPWRHPVLLTLTGRRYGADTDLVPTDPAERDINGIPWWVFLRKGNFKYIRTLVEGEIEELYDLAADPEELTNLALQPEHQSTLVEFRKALVRELRRTDAGMARQLPAVAQETR